MLYFFHINIKIHNNKINTKIYDKRDDFKFKINKFPNISGNTHAKRSHGIVVSQLLRFCKVCNDFDDFINVTKCMIHQCMNLYFDECILKQKVSRFYDKYYEYIKKYHVTKKYMMQ